MFSTDLFITLAISGLALLSVWVPFQRGARICFAARQATRRVETSELRPSGSGRNTAEPIALLLLRTLRRALQEGGSHPREFLVDASRQYAIHEYESHYARRISMYANILPPIGFIGTTGGLLVLFLSMRASNESMELSALAIALLSTVFALVGFATLEGMKIRLYGRLLEAVDGALSIQRAAEEKLIRARGTKRPAASAI